MNKTLFTENILKLRKDAGYRQEDVSRMLNIQRQTYCNYENALRTPPLEIVVALAKLYNVSVDFLVCGKETKNAKNSSGSLTDEERKLLDGFASLSDAKKREVIDFTIFKQNLPY